MGYFTNAPTLKDDDGKEYSGITFSIPNFSVYQNEYKTYLITARTEYRPDKIAWDLYGDDSLSWVIDEINGAGHASFYTKGKEIFYLPPAILLQLGI